MTVLKISKLQELYVKPCTCDWMAKVVFLIQMLPTFGSHCMNYCFFWGIGLKILRLPNLNMLFQLLLCFRDYRKLIKTCEEPLKWNHNNDCLWPVMSTFKAQRSCFYTAYCTPKGNSIINLLYFEIYYFKKGHDLILKC